MPIGGPAYRYGEEQWLHGHPREWLTVDRIIFDAVCVQPAWTSHSERSASCAIEWRDGARSVARWLIDDETQRAGTGFRRQRVGNFESPIIDRGIREKQLIRGSEIARIRTWSQTRTVDESYEGQLLGRDLPKNQMFPY